MICDQLKKQGAELSQAFEVNDCAEEEKKELEAVLTVEAAE